MFTQLLTFKNLESKSDSFRIVFDFDGTISDSFDLVVNIINYYADEFGYPVASHDEITKLRNLSSREVLQVSEIPFWKMPFLIGKVKKEMNHRMVHLNPIPGMKDVLGELKSRGCKLGILTSNSEKNVRDFLKRNHMDDLFEFIYSGSTLFGKDRVLKKILRQENIDLDRLIYVGDETRDVEAAKKMGIRAIAVSWGFNSSPALAAHNPDFLIHQPRELLHVLSQVRGNRYQMVEVGCGI
jgi:phosphoglycolate phosphatase